MPHFRQLWNPDQSIVLKKGYKSIGFSPMNKTPTLLHDHNEFITEHKGYKSLGFSPINKTPRLAHDHNEYLEERTFLRGIEIYEKIILKLGDLPEDKSN
ncbi:Aminoacylase-1B [Toxocara canis]|uniref:Aminoacylase-1B n=1 Tax=Toxocara canis TaxID=6265 RepID=A0A0B2V8B3_TOXCA|nr:Aminoacylase-1B [Toxocara canis]